MITFEDVLASIKTQTPEALLDKLANDETRAGLQELQRKFHDSYNPCRLMVAIIDQIPSSEWAKRDDFEYIAAKLLEKNVHPSVLTALTEKLLGLTIEEHQAQAALGPKNWIDQLSLNGEVNRIYGADKIIKPLREYIACVGRYEEVSLFIGKPVDSITRENIRAEISNMDPKEIVTALSDQKRFAALNRISDADLGELVAHTINQVPPEVWPQGKQLAETFTLLTSYKSPRALEALLGVIEKLPEATLLSQETSRSESAFGNHLVTWAFSYDVSSIASGTFQEYLPVVTSQTNPISDLISKRTGLAQATLDANQLFGTPDPATATAGFTPDL